MINFSHNFIGKTKKSIISNIIEKYPNLETKISERVSYSEIVECDKCGCLLYKGKASKGKGEIRTKRAVYFMHTIDEEYIHYPYYCKLHKPNRKGTK